MSQAAPKPLVLKGQSSHPAGSNSISSSSCGGNRGENVRRPSEDRTCLRRDRAVVRVFDATSKGVLTSVWRRWVHSGPTRRQSRCSMVDVRMDGKRLTPVHEGGGRRCSRSSTKTPQLMSSAFPFRRYPRARVGSRKRSRASPHQGVEDRTRNRAENLGSWRLCRTIQGRKSYRDGGGLIGAPMDQLHRRQSSPHKTASLLQAGCTNGDRGQLMLTDVGRSSSRPENGQGGVRVRDDVRISLQRETRTLAGAVRRRQMKPCRMSHDQLLNEGKRSRGVR